MIVRSFNGLPYVRASIGGALEILHLAAVASRQPLAKERQLAMLADGRDAAQIEPELGGARFDPGGGHT